MEEEKKTSMFKDDKDKKIFITRLICFILIGFIGPIIYLITRYNLFRPDTSMQIGLWGVIVFGILIGLAGTLIWFYLQAMKTKYSILKQCIHGLLKVILPLSCVALLLMWFRDNLAMVIESLWVFVCFELVAIPINPLPKWAFDNNVDGLGSIVKDIYDKTIPNRPSGKAPKESKTVKEK